MKPKHIQPTQIERRMREDDFIVSKTNPRGIITYCNPIFIEFSGYTEQALLGQQHNIIRHPDMPRTVYKLAWDTIESRREFFGYIKNLNQDGSYYWVFAHITPDIDPNGTLLGYTSVRRYPSPDAIQTITPVYQRMLSAEKSAGTRDALSAGKKVLDEFLDLTGKTYDELALSF